MYEGLAERFRTVPGVENILLGEPAAVHATPCLYTGLEDFEREHRGQIVAMRYRFVHRLLLVWVESGAAEAELLDLVPRLCMAVDADPTLGGRITSGLARIVRGPTGWVTISGTLYRFCDLTSDVLEKGPEGSL